MRTLLCIIMTVCSVTLFAQQTSVSNKTNTGKYVLVIHGGAGTLNKSQFTPALEAKYKSGLDSALLVGNAILEKGGTEDPMELYKSFRGAEPSVAPLLRKRGLDQVK